MKQVNKLKPNKVRESLENSFSGCIKIIIPILVIGLPTLLLVGFIILQIYYMYTGNWDKVESNIYFITSYIFIYLLGSAPKEGVLTKLLN